VIRVSKSLAQGVAQIEGDHFTGHVTLEELRQLASIDFREEATSLVVELESPIDKCERASERMRLLAEASRVRGAS